MTTASAPARLIRLGLSWYPMIRPGLTTESDKYPCGPVRSTRILSAPSARHGRSRRISGRKGQDGRDCPRFFRTGPPGGPSGAAAGRPEAPRRSVVRGFRGGLEVVHPAAGHARRSAFLLGLVGDDGLGGE